MPQSCCAYGCTNRRKKGGTLKFFTFPLKNVEKLKKWLHALRREGFKPTKYTTICSEHFSADAFVQRPNINFPYLKDDGISTIFPAYPKHLQKEAKPRLSRKRKADPAEPQKSSFEELTNQASISKEHPIKTTKRRCKRVYTQTEVALLKRIKILNQKVRRKQKKISTLKELLNSLTKKGLLERDPGKIIENHFDGTLCDMFQNELFNKKRTFKGRRYSKEIKHFAVTLLYYSPKAYNFCRSILSLPHPTSIRNWTSSVNAEPGFLKDAFMELSNRISMENRDCNLVFDGMAIRKQIIWNVKANQFIGYCDYGNEIRIEGSETAASEALVFMLVALNGKWKWPIGYFLINKTTACIQAQLVKTALTLASNAGLRVWSVSCDGTAANYGTLNI